MHLNCNVLNYRCNACMYVTDAFVLGVTSMFF